jgi:N utilization substance protein B
MTAKPRRTPPVSRSAARLGAVQALYQMDLAGTDVGEVLAQFSARAAGEAFEDGQCGEADFPLLRQIVDGVVREQAVIDPALNAALDPTWPLTRIDSTLRATLRAAAYEIMFMPNIPARVTITEYLDVAHAFFSGEEPSLVNGVLNRLAWEKREAEF